MVAMFYYSPLLNVNLVLSILKCINRNVVNCRCPIHKALFSYFIDITLQRNFSIYNNHFTFITCG